MHFEFLLFGFQNEDHATLLITNITLGYVLDQ